MILSPEILKCAVQNYGLNLTFKELLHFKFVDKIKEEIRKNTYFRKWTNARSQILHTLNQGTPWKKQCQKLFEV